MMSGRTILIFAITACVSTFALGGDMEVDKALELASRCGAAAVTGRGAFAGQLTADDLKLRAPR